jgi:REP element-mobilizing transposase RayT
MTTARSNQIDLGLSSYYHCMTRCVRRSYLCGYDYETGHDYSHRKPWIISRIKHLASIFAIHICAYAIMSNHYHLVLFVDDSQANAWDDEEVHNRWLQLFPKDAKALTTYSRKEAEQKITLWRHRLMDISWFMRCLNENIARHSNKEDETKGRFWEGRFKSQALLDEGALLTAMVYVDLNPIRANIADSPETSDFTSIQDRLRLLAKELKNCKSADTLEKRFNQCKQPNHLVALASNFSSNNKGPIIDYKLSDYLQLVESTGRVIREDKRGAIPQELAPILSQLDLNPKTWLSMVINLQSGFSYAIGHSAILREFNKQHRTHGPKGISIARKCYTLVA